MALRTLVRATRPRLASSPAAVAYLAAALILCVGGWQIIRARDANLLDAERDTRNLAASLAQHATRSVETVDIILTGAVDEIEAGALRDLERFKTFLIRRARSVGHVHSFAVLDARGVRLADSLASDHPPTDSGDREYFASHRDRRSGELHVGERITGRTSGLAGIPLSRRWNRSDGSFGGVVVAFLSPEAFGRFYDTLGIGAQGRISLFSTAGRVLVRHPAAAVVEEMDLSRTPLFTDRIPRAASGAYHAVSPIDGVERVTAYETLTGYPVVLIAALSIKEILAPWRREALIEMTVLTAAAGALVFLGLALARREARASAAEAARRRYKNRLRGKNALLDATLGNMDQGLMMVDAAGVVRVCNERATALLELPPAMMAGEPTFEAVRRYQLARDEFARSGEDLRQWVERTGLEERPRTYERERPNGTVLEIRTVPLPDGGAVRTYTDVTAQRGAENALRASEARYRQLAETTSDVITHLRLPDFARIYVSPACRALFGCEPEELLGRRPSASNMHPDDADAVRGQAARLARGESEHEQVTYRAQHKDGRWLWIEASLSLLRDEPTGRPEAIVCSLRDVSERLRHAEELAQAKREAEAASAAKSEFLASMSHEIRTPLNGVIGYADLLLDDPALSEEQRRQAERIQVAGHALLMVVNDILDFSEIEAGRVELHPRPFRLVGLVDDATSIVRASAERKELALRVDMQAGLPDAVLGDEDRLRQVLLNLLNNAIKFTPSGVVTLRVGFTGSDPGERWLRFDIEDTGIGIPADKRERLFQRFSQVDGSVRRAFGGTGLGLAISRHLVALMGGEIGVESEAGRGSSFWFTAALAEVVLEHDGARAGGPPSAPCDARILLVEDVAMSRDLAQAVLERAGYVVDVAADGTEAVMAIKASAYDLVLMDVQMPGMDGLTATGLIRALDGPARDVPVVAMTANVLPAQVARMRATGMDDHVGKPFRRNDLLDVVRKWCGGGPVTEVSGKIASPGREDVHDAAVFADVLALVGREAAIRLLREFAEELSSRLGRMASEQDRSVLAFHAHALITPAGFLGFGKLAEACRAVEQASTDGASIDAPLDLLSKARYAVLDEVVCLTTAAGADRRIAGGCRRPTMSERPGRAHPGR